jgi:hypothetical protein
MRTKRMLVSGLLIGVMALWAIAAGRDNQNRIASAKNNGNSGNRDNPRLEGSWLVDATVTGDPTEIHALLTCTSNGEVVETPSVATAVSTGHGAWIKTGRNEFAITVVYLRRGAAGEFLGTSKVRSQFLVNEVMTEGGGQFETQVFDAAGQPIGSFEGTAQATRILAEPLL